MKKIQNVLESIQSLQAHMMESIEDSNTIDEGLKDFLSQITSKVKKKLGNLVEKVFSYAKGVVAKLKKHYMAVDEDGNILPCSTPMTMGAAWKDGDINKKSTFVGMGKESGAIVGTSEPFENALNMYPSTLDAWRDLYKANGFHESVSEEEFIDRICEYNENNESELINEVKLANSDPFAKYNVIADNNMLRKMIKLHVKHPKLSKLMIWGAPGIGKSAILRTIVDEIAAEQGKDYGLVVKTLSNETPDNFFLPKYTVDGRAEDVPKTWLPVYKPTGDAAEDKKLDEMCGSGLLFVDELSRATPQVLNVILPLVNEGDLNGWKMGSGWSIVCASNRDEDELSGQTAIGNALANRFAHIYYEPTVHTWRQWADKQGFMSPLLLQWLSMPESESLAGGKFYYYDPNEELDDGTTTKLMCTPRSWTDAMREIAELHHTGTLEGFNIFDIDEDVLRMFLNKHVPSNATESFLGFLRVIQSIGDFDKAVESAWKNNGSGLSIAPKDLIKVALPLAQLVICAHKDKLPTEDEFNSFANWLVSANNEQLASYSIDIFKNVFGANIPDEKLTSNNFNSRECIFLLAKLHEKYPENFSDSGKVKIFDNFLDSWSITYDSMPDYSNGLQIIGKKYAEAFKSAVVDGVEALG